MPTQMIEFMESIPFFLLSLLYYLRFVMAILTTGFISLGILYIALTVYTRNAGGEGAGHQKMANMMLKKGATGLFLTAFIFALYAFMVYHMNNEAGMMLLLGKNYIFLITQ